jgi:hypothetical protein
MKKKHSQPKTATSPSRSKLGVLHQICNLILTFLVARLARETGVESQARSASGLCRGTAGPGLARRFRRVISVVDSTTIQLVASYLDWAKHRRRKAAAKCHLRLDLHSFLPRFAIIDTAREICAGIRPGEIVLFDKAYVDFAHLWALTLRGIFWVTRAKDNLVFDDREAPSERCDSAR